MSTVRFAISAVIAAVAFIGCGKEGGRTEPTCAVRDCKTGKVIDDGCVDGLFSKKCAACTVLCPDEKTLR